MDARFADPVGKKRKKKFTFLMKYLDRFKHKNVKKKKKAPK